MTDRHLLPHQETGEAHYEEDGCPTLDRCPAGCGRATQPQRGQPSLCLPCTEQDTRATLAEHRARISETLAKGRTRKWAHGASHQALRDPETPKTPLCPACAGALDAAAGPIHPACDHYASAAHIRRTSLGTQLRSHTDDEWAWIRHGGRRHTNQHE